ncbi:MAG: hypothetical protein GY832_26090 [Chloroflexi bacterium]|nr:hypothetical protein [Chloroflexota bacterium]
MTNQSTALVTRQMADTLTVAEHLAQSGFFSDARQMSQAVTKVLAGQELGLGPVASMTGIYIINNKVALSANILSALVKRHSVYDYRVRSHSAQECTLVFYQGEHEIGVSSFTWDDATTAGLTGGKNSHTWKKYPRNMLFARAVSNGVKWFCPDVMAGAPVYTPDELGATVDGEGAVIPGEYTETGPGRELPQVVVDVDSIKWALAQQVNGGEKFMCQANRANLLYIKKESHQYSEDVLEAALILLHEDATEIRADLEGWEADLHAAIEAGDLPTQEERGSALPDEAYGHDLPPTA